MTLNIKEPEAQRLALAIAEATGLKRDPEALAADIRAIAERAAAHLKRPYLDHAELLYDEHGLPK